MQVGGIGQGSFPAFSFALRQTYPYLMVQKLKIKKPKTHWRKRNRHKPNTTIMISNLAYERFTHELPDVNPSVRGLKSLTPLAIQCQNCFLLVATLPNQRVDYLIGMSNFMQNKIAIEHGDHRRLCSRCQLDHWKDYLSVIESDTARRYAYEQTRLVDRVVY